MQTQLERLKEATDRAAEPISAAVSTAEPATAEQTGPGLGAGTDALRMAPSFKPARLRGLHSSMKLEDGLRNHWYPAHFMSVRSRPF